MREGFGDPDAIEYARGEVGQYGLGVKFEEMNTAGRARDEVGIGGLGRGIGVMGAPDCCCLGEG